MPCNLTTNLFHPHILQKQILSVAEPKKYCKPCPVFMNYVGVDNREVCYVHFIHPSCCPAYYSTEKIETRARLENILFVIGVTLRVPSLKFYLFNFLQINYLINNHNVA